MIMAPAGETVTLKGLWYKSTGAFVIEGMRDAAGTLYTDASPDVPIPHDLLRKAQVSPAGLGVFDPPITIPPRGIFYITVRDTSGAANTITLVFEGTRE
jgi:hypothetical protein